MRGSLAIVQARLSSTRLPGKSVADVVGEPMLAMLIRRLRRASELDGIVIATTTEQLDNPIVELGTELGCGVYRGALNDVLGRFVGAAGSHRGAIVRITADCPLIDPSVVDDVIRLFWETPLCAYASNIEPTRTFPVGLDTEVISRAVLEQLDKETDDPTNREHVTWGVRHDLGRFRTAALVCDGGLGDLRWTVDTQDDLTFMRELVARLGPRRHEARMREILAAIRRAPSLADFLGRRG